MTRRVLDAGEDGILMSEPKVIPWGEGQRVEIRESKPTDWVMPAARPVDPDWPSTWTVDNSATIPHKFKGIDDLVEAVRNLTGAVRVLNRTIREQAQKEGRG